MRIYLRLLRLKAAWQADMACYQTRSYTPFTFQISTYLRLPAIIICTLFFMLAAPSLPFYCSGSGQALVGSALVGSALAGSALANENTQQALANPKAKNNNQSQTKNLASPFESVSTAKGFETATPSAAQREPAIKSPQATVTTKHLSLLPAKIQAAKLTAPTEPQAAPALAASKSALAYDDKLVDTTPTGSLNDDLNKQTAAQTQRNSSLSYDDGLTLPISAIPDPLGSESSRTGSSSSGTSSSGTSSSGTLGAKASSLPMPEGAQTDQHPMQITHSQQEQDIRPQTHLSSMAGHSAETQQNKLDWPANAPAPFYRGNNTAPQAEVSNASAYPHVAQAAISALTIQGKADYGTRPPALPFDQAGQHSQRMSPQAIQPAQSGQVTPPNQTPPPTPAMQANIATQPRAKLHPQFLRQEVALDPDEFGFHAKPGDIIIDTEDKFLFLVEPKGRALRYGIGVGRPGFLWAGTKTITRKAEWPDWTPPDAMLMRRPDLPRHMKGGIDNPLGARALYLGSSLYRIHGTNEPATIGHNVSSGCIRLTNEDVSDLYARVKVGTKVVVLR